MADAHVGIGQLHVADVGGALTAAGLGSCVGVVIGDRTTGVAGMAHVMLPDSAGRDTTSSGRFADLAVPALVAAVREAGARPTSLRAWIAGGASMFAPDVMRRDIGTDNIAAVRAALAKVRVSVDGDELGGTHGRSLVLGADRRIVVRRAGQPEIELGVSAMASARLPVAVR